MKINATITLLFNSEGLHIELHDEASCITFLDVRMSQEQTLQAMSRLSHTHCDCEVFQLDLVGKQRYDNILEFPMPKHDYKNRDKIATEAAHKACPQGWVSSDYFGSQNSFFYKDNQEYARCSIHQWKESTNANAKGPAD